MTATLLLAAICAALLFQLAAGIGLALWRRSATPKPFVADAAGTSAPAGAWSGWREFRVTRREFEDSRHSQCSFYLEPTDGAALTPYKPGQFLTFSLPVRKAGAGAHGGERALTRCYSLSDQPDPKHYRITVKRVPAPPGRTDLPAGASSSYFHDHVQEGQVLKVKAPSGHFFIDAGSNVPAVLIGGGIGITPLMSMLCWCLKNQPDRPVHLYYGLRQGDEHAFRQQLEQLGATYPRFHLHVVYSRAGPGDVAGRDYHHAGHVDVALLRKTLPHGRHQFYVCGPASMMENLVPALAAWGVDPRDIHFEAFGPASVGISAATPDDATPVRTGPLSVQFRRAGRTLVWDGQDASLLDFAERQGVPVDSGCRSGSCGSCETRLVSGGVRYTRPPDHDVAPGHCLLCVGMPTSALILEA